MADDVTGAVRRTPRPHPADDHQTPETGAPVAPGATNPATPVSRDAGTGTGPLSPEAAEALAALRAKLAEGGPVVFAGPECDPEAYAALPPCTACEGGGQDTHGTAFEAPLAVHFAGPPVRAEGRQRQLCMWCGHVLIDVALTRDTEPPEWPVSALIKVEDGVATVLPHEPGAELPPGCCALPDDEPDFPPPVVDVHLPPMPGEDQAGAEPWCEEHGHPANRCSYCACDRGEIDESQEARAAADWPAEPVDTHADEVDRG